MEGNRSPSPEIWDCYLKNIFPNMFSNTSLDFILDMGVTDHDNIIDNIENKKKNLLLQEYSLKNRSFWKLVILLETYMKQRQ